MNRTRIDKCDALGWERPKLRNGFRQPKTSKHFLQKRQARKN